MPPDVRSGIDSDRAPDLVANRWFSIVSAMIEREKLGQQGHQRLKRREECHLVRIVGSASRLE
jgi:hypothetical protein